MQIKRTYWLSSFLPSILYKSRNYNASITINCGLKENFESFSEYLNIETDIVSPFKLESSETKTGRLVVTLKKAYDKALETTAEIECKLVATPEERETLGDEYVSIISTFIGYIKF